MVYDVNGNALVSEYISGEKVYDLIDVGTLSPGLVNTSNGEIGENNNYRSSDYIAVSADKIYRATETAAYNNYNTACYNAQKQFLGAATLGDYNYEYYDVEENQYFYCELDFPEGTVFIRTSTYKDVETIYLSTSPLSNPFDIEETRVIVTDPEKIVDALGVPNLDFIKRFKNKTMIVAGDSITAHGTTASKVWHDWLSEWLGLTIYNDGKSGTGLAKNYQYQGSTIYRIENLWAELYPADPDIILVMGNQNDGTGGGGGYSDTYPGATGGVPPSVGTISDSASTFTEYGIMRRLLEDLTTMYPTAKIGVISSTPRDNDIDTYWSEKPKSYGLGWYHDYVEAQKEVCADFGVPFLDLYHSNPVLRPYIGGNVAEFYADGSSTPTPGTATGAVHPNNAGHLEGIARPAYEWMLKWI